MGKIPLKTMEHGATAKFHGFRGEISMLAWKNIPHESMESIESKTTENHGKHGNLQK